MVSMSSAIPMKSEMPDGSFGALKRSVWGGDAIDPTEHRGVIFDLDGTLLDTIDGITDATNAALAHLGFPGHDREGYRSMVGDGFAALCRRALPPHHRHDRAVAACMAALRPEYARRAVARTKAYPGIPGLLHALHHRGIAMAVLSNKDHDLTVHVVRHLLPWRLFTEIRGLRDGDRPKPDPTVALEIAARLGGPAATVFVGDSDTDMQLARSAGFYAVGALWGFRTAAALNAAGAEYLARDPADLLPLFDTTRHGTR